MKRMLGVLLVSGAMLVAAAGAHAAVKSLVGVKGGVSIEKLHGDLIDAIVPSDLQGNRTGFAGGIFYQADFSRNFGVRVEGLYFNKGLSADSAGVNLTFKLDYIEFPILAVAQIPISETGTVSFFAGPTLGFNSSAKIEASYQGLSGSGDIGDWIKGFEFGLTFGAGLNFDVGSVILGVDGRYGFGLTTVAESNFADENGVPGDVDLKTGGFAIMASVGFPIGSK